MKLFKKAKKGFTLIELVVVIAVIAVLSAVAVVSYISITNRAKESNDHMVIDQINTSLLSSQILEKKATVHEIVERFDEEEGYDVRTIKPELKDTEFVYSYSMNKFAYWKGNKVVYPKDVAESSSATGEDLWFFKDVQSGASLTEGHSYYVKSAPANATITVDGGIDVGSQSFSSITYANNSSAKEVVIRTNSASTNIILNPYVDSTDSTKGDHIEFYGSVGQVTGPKDGDGNYNGFTVAFNSFKVNGKVVALKAASGHIDLTNAVAEEGEEIIILATTTDVKVSNPKKVTLHAHATSESNANSMNDPADSTKKSVGVTWDYDGNVAQNVIDDIHHHITQEQAAEAGESLGTGPVDGGENWVYEEVVETAIEGAVNKEEVEKAEEAGYVITHHEAKAPSCTEVGYYAYDSYEVNSEVVKIGYKEIPATGHTKAKNPVYAHNFNGQWQHATQCSVCGDWIVEYCIDDNHDNECDECGQQMVIEVYSISDLVNSEDDIVANSYKLMADISLTKMTYIKSVATIDLNGHTFSNYPLNSPADAQFRSYTGNNATMILNLKDSSAGKTGMFISRFGNTFYDGSNSNKVNPRFIINCEDGVTINTCYDYQGNEMNSFSGGMTYFLNNISKNVEINNAHLIIGSIAMVNSGYTVTFKNCTIESRNSSGMLQGGSGNIVYDGCTITTVMQSSSGNVLDSSDPNVTFINGTTVNGVAK